MGNSRDLPSPPDQGSDTAKEWATVCRKPKCAAARL
jgi:hypothetical protein